MTEALRGDGAAEGTAALWRPRPALLAFAVLALAGYLLLDLAFFPLATNPGDERRFVSEAIDFARTGEFWVWQHRATEMPLTGLIYGGLYKIAGSEAGLVALARALQALLLVAQAWICGDLARRLFPHGLAAPLAFVGILVYPMLIAFQTYLVSEALFIFFLMLGVWCLYRWAQGPATTGRLVAYAAAMVAAVYVKASLTFLPVLLPGLLLAAHGSWRAAAKATLICAVVYAACLSPWWIRNAQIFGQPVLFTTSSAAQLYLGNNRANVAAGNDWASDVEKEWVESIKDLPELEQQKRFHERAMQYIKAEPLTFAANAARKFIRFWNVIPNHEMWRQGAYPWIVGLSYGPALALSLLAVWLYRSRWRHLLPIYVLVAYFTLLHTVTIASIRYRLPLEPFLIIFAAGAVAHLCMTARGRRATASTR